MTTSPGTLATSSGPPQSPTSEIKSRSPAQDALLRLLSSKSSMIGLTIFVLMILVAVFAPLIARYDPTMQFRDGLHADGSPLVLPRNSGWARTLSAGISTRASSMVRAARWRLPSWRTSSRQ